MYPKRYSWRTRLGTVAHSIEDRCVLPLTAPSELFVDGDGCRSRAAVGIPDSSYDDVHTAPEVADADQLQTVNLGP